jgi:hypothetical protein
MKSENRFIYALGGRAHEVWNRVVIGSAGVSSYYMVSGVAFALRNRVMEKPAPLAGFALPPNCRASRRHGLV